MPSLLLRWLPALSTEPLSFCHQVPTASLLTWPSGAAQMLLEQRTRPQQTTVLGNPQHALCCSHHGQFTHPAAPLPGAVGAEAGVGSSPDTPTGHHTGGQAERADEGDTLRPVQTPCHTRLALEIYRTLFPVVRGQVDNGSSPAGHDHTQARTPCVCHSPTHLVPTLPGPTPRPGPTCPPCPHAGGGFSDPRQQG